TGANLEEDLFNLLAYKEYEIIPDWRALSAEDEKALYDRGFNRVTDTCIPETIMRHMEKRLIDRWKEACDKGERKFESEFLWDLFRDGKMESHYQIPKENSWFIAAQEKGLPIYSPGWEDSTTGNMFAAAVYRGAVPHHQCVKSGTEQMEHLLRWYLANCNMGTSSPSVGFFQVGGGIAGDFAICAVPTIIQDLQREDVPFWDYFCQISDAVTSYGGYSGAVPNEKITWGKLDVDTPKFMIQSDATIVAPLVFGYLLGE
ncbi:MAG TPA: deoxyhypusine synthase family protein, partial [Myxococcota bacterium]|nr:deoxyhypusine synthase family protein [Myxococcota bacterium]